MLLILCPRIVTISTPGNHGQQYFINNKICNLRIPVKKCNFKKKLNSWNR